MTAHRGRHDEPRKDHPRVRRIDGQVRDHKLMTAQRRARIIPAERPMSGLLEYCALFISEGYVLAGAFWTVIVLITPYSTEAKAIGLAVMWALSLLACWYHLGKKRRAARAARSKQDELDP